MQNIDVSQIYKLWRTFKSLQNYGFIFKLAISFKITVCVYAFKLSTSFFVQVNPGDSLYMVKCYPKTVIKGKRMRKNTSPQSAFFPCCAVDIKNASHYILLLVVWLRTFFLSPIKFLVNLKTGTGNIVENPLKWH